MSVTSSLRPLVPLSLLLLVSSTALAQTPRKLIAAGNESTRSVIAHGMRLLMEHPVQLQKLIDDPSLIPHAVEEVLRFNPAFVQTNPCRS